MSEVTTSNLARQIATQLSPERKKPAAGDVGTTRKDETAPELTRQTRVQAEKAAQALKERLQRVVQHMNDFIQSEQRDLRFSIDEGSGEMVISVLERESGELIRQIPNDQFLEMARRARNEGMINLIKVNG